MIELTKNVPSVNQPLMKVLRNPVHKLNVSQGYFAPMTNALITKPQRFPYGYESHFSRLPAWTLKPPNLRGGGRAWIDELIESLDLDSKDCGFEPHFRRDVFLVRAFSKPLPPNC